MISELRGEIQVLEKRCNALRMQVDQCRLDADRWAKAFDLAVELREVIEQQLAGKIDELVDETEQQAALLSDAAKSEQEYESLVERATRDVFRLLDLFGVKFDSNIALRTALDALVHRLSPDHSVPLHPPTEVPFNAKDGAAFMLQAVQRAGVHTLLDEGVLLAWWANIAMRGYDECYRKYQPLIEAATKPKQSGASRRGEVYSRDDEQAIADAAEAYVDWSAPELQSEPISHMEEVAL